MKTKLKLSAIVLFALMSTAPAQASDWLSWFGLELGSGTPVVSTTGVGGGGGNPPGPIDPN
ncbi:hypothetical protein KIH87_16925 [Paraneptunicella aestuarii]|uniref:hypothetical protein n=1 Tax=Paraneptunicella aestuarii TaxID=2831148 RepID=UPI001E4F4884|nr:hypothetical protein [Paraneptunicella aestuarii]UAA38348.1 hypothetical protein KIH87_16925 [Paraneptunicella aestuarii]